MTKFITMESEAFQKMVQKVDAVHRELIRLQNPARELSKDWIDTHDVLQILKISRRTLTKYLGEGRLKYTRIENKNFFKLKDVEEFLYNGYGIHRNID